MQLGIIVSNSFKPWSMKSRKKKLQDTTLIVLLSEVTFFFNCKCLEIHIMPFYHSVLSKRLFWFSWLGYFLFPNTYVKRFAHEDRNVTPFDGGHFKMAVSYNMTKFKYDNMTKLLIGSKWESVIDAYSQANEDPM